MAARLNPYISFPGSAREAMQFYEQVFGGTVQMTTFGEAGAQGVPDPEKVMHALLETPSGFTLMGADTPSRTEHEPSDDIAISLSGEDAEELRGYWTRLADGGVVTVPLEKQMWGDEFGMCKDRFGVPWMVNIVAPAA